MSKEQDHCCDHCNTETGNVRIRREWDSCDASWTVWELRVSLGLSLGVVISVGQDITYCPFCGERLDG